MPDSEILIHLVHGTWGDGVGLGRGLRASLGLAPRPPQNEPRWFAEDSPFAAALRAALPPAVGKRVRFVPFRWSGSNSFSARSTAADALYRRISEAAGHYPLPRQILIGHSHGGTVIAEALLSHPSLATLMGVEGVATMATPYLALSMSTEAAGFVSWLAPAAILSLYVLFTAALWLTGSGTWAAWLLALGAAWAAGALPRGVISRIALALAALASVSVSAALAWPLLEGAAKDVSQVGAADLATMAGALAIPATTLLFLFATCIHATAPRNEDTAVLLDVCRSTRGFALSALMIAAILWTIASASPYAFAFPLAFWLVVGGGLGVGIADLFRKQFGLWGQALVDDQLQPPALPCPWLALRLPGDEASLAIAAGQVARTWFDLPLAAWAALKGLATGCPRRLALAIAAIAVLVDVAIAWTLGQSRGEGWLAISAYALALPALIGAWAALVALPLVALAFLAVAVLASTLQALAAGSDLSSVFTAVRLDAEPLPRCANPERSQLLLLWPDKAHQPAGLRHSAYDCAEVPQRIAAWIAGLPA